VYGPAGNSEFPSTADFVHAFFNSRNGIYRYLSVLLVPQEEGGYELQPHNVVGDPSSVAFRGEHLSAYAAPVIHGSVPALAWRRKVVVLSLRERGSGSVSANRRIGVSASEKTAFRHGYNDQKVSTKLMTLCKCRLAGTPTRFPSRRPIFIATSLKRFMPENLHSLIELLNLQWLLQNRDRTDLENPIEDLTIRVTCDHDNVEVRINLLGRLIHLITRRVRQLQVQKHEIEFLLPEALNGLFGRTDHHSTEADLLQKCSKEILQAEIVVDY
jgi:hypothetical protein